jgi:hypothetical protein
LLSSTAAVVPVAGATAPTAAMPSDAAGAPTNAGRHQPLDQRSSRQKTGAPAAEDGPATVTEQHSGREQAPRHPGSHFPCLFAQPAHLSLSGGDACQLALGTVTLHAQARPGKPAWREF